MKAFWVQMIDLDLIFLLYQGTLSWQPILWKKWQIPHFVALAFGNEMGYHYLNVHINRANDASISCENFAKFGQVTPELIELICERQVRRGQKKLAYFVEYLRMYWTNFSNLFTVWKRFLCNWWICILFSNLSRDNNVERNEKLMKVDWYYLHSLH